MKRILLTGAGGAAAQNFLASLRMSGDPYYVVGTDVNALHLSCAEVDERFVLPRCDEPGYLPVLQEMIAREDIEFVHPQPDSEVAFLSQHRESLRAHIFLPPDLVIRLCQDKAACNEVLTRHGIPVPLTFPLKADSDVSTLLQELRTRGQRIWVRAIKGAGSRAALPVETERQALDWIHYWTSVRGLERSDFMIAEYLPGREFAFQSLWYDGELVTSMARERMEYIFGNLMPSGQSSSPSIARSVHRDDVNEIGIGAVRAISDHPHGIFCVDMKEDANGIPCVTEINAGRFFTTSNFFAAAGSNMPHYYVRLAYGESIPDLPSVNAVDADLYWVRGVDRRPTLIEEGACVERPLVA